MYKNTYNQGLTLVEMLIALAFFTLTIAALFRLYQQIWQTTGVIRSRNIITNLANEQFEIARNLPYENVGTIDGLVPGSLAQRKNVVREGVNFCVETFIRNYDDPFDGTVDGNPGPIDTTPADSRIVQVHISEIGDCDDLDSLPDEDLPDAHIFIARISPERLETTSDNGSLRINVINGAGDPIPNVTVQIENDEHSIAAYDSTNVNGELLIIDIPPSFQGYKLSTSKSGYSTDRTYSIGDPTGNDDPTKKHATIAANTLTEITFQIDTLSTVNIASTDKLCNAIGSIDFDMHGSKQIGDDPVIYKYSDSHTTSGSGTLSIADMEWDSYYVTLTDESYFLAGLYPLNPFSLEPDSTQDVSIILEPATSTGLLVAVRDEGTGEPIDGATVSIVGTSFSETQTTGRGVLRQVDWSGGGGQEIFINDNEYYGEDALDNIDVSEAGILQLENVFGTYVTDGYVESSTFDMGSTSNLFEVDWLPEVQDPETGENSVTMQVSTSTTASGPWLDTSFIGPDGTSESFYTRANRTTHVSHDDNQYVRYRLYLETADTAYSPEVTSASFTFASECVPPGQVYFSEFSTGTYLVTVDHPDYISEEIELIAVDGWQFLEVTLAP